MSAERARGFSRRASAYATGHQLTRGCPDESSTASASGSNAPSRASANTPSRNAAAGVSRRASSSSDGGTVTTPDSTMPPIRRPIAGAAAASPSIPSACAALPCTRGDGSPSAASSGSRVVTSPIRPSANAAICRTSGSASPSSGTSSGAPSFRPMRPTASAARRRIRASESASSVPRSSTGGGGATMALAPRAATAGVAGGGRRLPQNASILEPQNRRHLLFEVLLRRDEIAFDGRRARARHGEHCRHRHRRQARQERTAHESAR